MELTIPIKISQEAIRKAISKHFQQHEIKAIIRIDIEVGEYVKPKSEFNF